MNTTPMGALLRQAQTRPTRTAFIFQGETWTYGRLAAEAEHLACGLAARGVKPGDRIALHMMNRPEMIVAYYACFRLGAVAAPLRTAFKPAELAPILQRLKPALYIGEAGLYENVAPVEGSILASDKRVIVGQTAAESGLQSWEMLFGGVTAMRCRLRQLCMNPWCCPTHPEQPASPNSSFTRRQPYPKPWT